jgi:two-component system LytT family response regulator
MIKAMIVDDEKNSCEALQLLLQSSCPDVEVIGVVHSAKDALAQLPGLKPQLVFLDIEMSHMNGFHMLEVIPVIDFSIIFTTSYDQYAIKAFKYCALDYLLKPVDREELEKAVQKLPAKHNDQLSQQLDILLQRISKPTLPVQKIALPTMQGLEMVSVNTIIHCSSNNNYTEFFLADKKKILVSRTLKEIGEILEDHAFLRVHHSHIVNLNEIVRYIKGEGGQLIMTDGSTVDVSRSRKELLMQKLHPSKF